jgi:hypothetical protein
MAGLVHPGITYIALQQNATASRMPPGGTCVHCSKREARHKQKMWEIILYHACVACMGRRRVSGMKMASLRGEDVANSGKLPVAVPVLSL